MKALFTNGHQHKHKHRLLRWLSLNPLLHVDSFAFLYDGFLPKRIPYVVLKAQIHHQKKKTTKKQKVSFL